MRADPTDEREIFPDHGGGGERGDLGRIVGGRDLDDIHAGELQRIESAQHGLHLPAREPADLRRAGTGRESGIEAVDIEGEIGGRVIDNRSDAFAHGLRPGFVHILRRDHGHAAAERPVVDIPLHRRADADLHGALRIDEAFLDRVEEHRAVRVTLSEIVGPGIDMRIEMDKRERSRRACERARAAAAAKSNDRRRAQ